MAADNLLRVIGDLVKRDSRLTKAEQEKNKDKMAEKKRASFDDALNKILKNQSKNDTEEVPEDDETPPEEEEGFESSLNLCTSCLEEGNCDDFRQWDLLYYKEKLKKQKYDFDEETLRPYFKTENVLNGVFTVPGDGCIDYKAGKIDEDLKRFCPKGIDIYFENVGGKVTRAVSKLLNPGSRVPICGFISKYNSEDMMNEETPFHVFGSMDPVPEHRFFVVTEWFDKWKEATFELANWIKEGKIKYRETVTEGIENAPQALRDVLSGRNFGKQLIKVAEE